MAEIRIFDTLRAIDAAGWNACFANEVENYDYLLAVEEAGIEGFTIAYVTAWNNDTLIAAMPAFRTIYMLDTTLQGRCKKIAAAITAVFPNLLILRLACLGSPCTEAGMAGFNPQVSELQKPPLLTAMVTEFERYAAAHGSKLLGIKDIPETMYALWNSALQACRYATLPGLPTAYLTIDFTSMDEYMAQLSPATRKNMRRKLKALDAVDIRTVTSLDGVMDSVMALYHDTVNRSDWQFETLPEAYFNGLLSYKPGQSFCNLYYVDNRLLAANLLIHDGHTMIDHIFCMNAQEGKTYNLYFLSWVKNIQTCIDKGITHYQCGQMNYEDKMRLGCKLTRHSMYFKHRNRLVQRMLKLASPLFAADNPYEQRL